MKKIFKISVHVFVLVFAVIGLFLTGGFFAVKWGLTNVSGAIDLDDRSLPEIGGGEWKAKDDGGLTISSRDICKLSVIANSHPETGSSILRAVSRGSSPDIVSSMIFAAARTMSENNVRASEAISICDSYKGSASGDDVVPWMNTEEWKVFEEAVKKDGSLIREVGRATGVSPRLIVGELVGEQLRLFNSERDAFKKFFAPLKILGNETKFSLGVTGIKEETAIMIEDNLKDRGSVFYLGPEYEDLLDFNTSDKEKERIERLTDKRDRYYPYLYTALFVKQIVAQWERAGYPIDDRPEIIGTLWNIGFKGSKPNADPKSGGALIRIGNEEYTFGSLVYGFYYSGRLIDEFPYENK